MLTERRRRKKKKKLKQYKTLRRSAGRVTRHACVITMTRTLPAYVVTPSDSAVTFDPMTYMKGLKLMHINTHRGYMIVLCCTDN